MNSINKKMDLNNRKMKNRPPSPVERDQKRFTCRYFVGMPLHDALGANCEKGATISRRRYLVCGLRGVCWRIVRA